MAVTLATLQGEGLTDGRMEGLFWAEERLTVHAYVSPTLLSDLVS
jgi:hypothetical protein